jgi:hypothetical protein
MQFALNGVRRYRQFGEALPDKKRYRMGAVFKATQDGVQMPDQDAKDQNLGDPSRSALSRWDDERGAGLSGSQDVSLSKPVPSAIPPLTNTELVQLRVRVIALENVVISLLAQSSDRQLDRVRDVAAYIAPRPGFTPHSLTIHAAAEMVHLVERARHFQGLDDSMIAPVP